MKKALHILIYMAAAAALVSSATSCDLVDQIRYRVKSARAKVEQTRAAIRGDVPTGPVTVRVMAACSTDGLQRASYVGSVEPSRSVTLSAANSGTLEVLNVKNGSRVAAGAVVAKVESQSVRSAYEMACSKLAQAQDGYDRLKKVHSSGSVADVKMVEIETALAQAKAAKDAAEKALWHCTLKAPFSGVVEDVYKDRGVEVTIAEPIVRIVDVSTVEIHISIPENEIASVKVGDRARIEIPALDRVTTAKISSKGVVASALSHSYDCILSGVANSEGLMPGMVCKVSLEKDAGSGIVLPATCVMTDMDGRYVWTVTDGIVGKNHILVGGYSGDGIIVSGGLEDVEYVIIEGARKVSTGMKVETVE